MLKDRAYILSAFFLSFLIFAIGCGEESSRFQSLSDSAQNSRVKIQNEPLYLKGGDDEKEPSMSFTHLATAEAPRSEKGNLLQASHFLIQKSVAYVAYMSAGSSTEGALDVIDIKKPEHLSLTKTIVFEDEEFSDIRASGDYLIAVGAHGETSSESASAWVRVFKAKEAFSPEPVFGLALPGHFATSLMVDGSKAYVSVGDNSGLYILNLEKLPQIEIENFYPLAQANFVGMLGKKRVLIGNRGCGACLFEDRGLGSFAAIATIASRPLEAPISFLEDKNYLVTNPGEEGLQIYSYEEIFSSSPSASKSETQIRLKKISTTALKGRGNGAALDWPYAFLAQGSEGLQVYDLKSPESPRFLGAFDFSDDPGSANAVQVNNYHSSHPMVFLGDGLGGFRVIQGSRKD